VLFVFVNALYPFADCFNVIVYGGCVPVQPEPTRAKPSASTTKSAVASLSSSSSGSQSQAAAVPHSRSGIPAASSGKRKLPSSAALGKADSAANAASSAVKASALPTPAGGDDDRAELDDLFSALSGKKRKLAPAAAPSGSARTQDKTPLPAAAAAKPTQPSGDQSDEEDVPPEGIDCVC